MGKNFALYGVGKGVGIGAFGELRSGEGYAASLEKERKRKYLLKNRNRGLGDPPASVGVDSPNPDGGVAGEPPASVGEVTQPPTGAPGALLPLSTYRQRGPTLQLPLGRGGGGGDGQTGGQKRKRTFTVVKKKAGGKGGKGRASKPQTSHPALVPKPEPSPLLSGGAARIGRAAKPPKARRPFGTTASVPIPPHHQTPHEQGCAPPRKYSIQPAEAVECELFMLPEQYSLSGIYPD